MTLKYSDNTANLIDRTQHQDGHLTAPTTAQLVNNDYDKFRSFFPSLYDFISASNLHVFAWKSRQIFSGQSPMARWQHSVTGLIINRRCYCDSGTTCDSCLTIAIVTVARASRPYL